MTTANLGLTLPTVGADSDTWGGELNTDLGLIDVFAGSLMPGAEATVASASTADIGAAVSTAVVVTGTVTITSFGVVANTIRFVRFSGALTLTHNGTSLILLGAANHTTAAGDCGLYRSDGSGNWRELAYSPAAYNPDSHTGTGAYVHSVAPTLGAISATSLGTSGGVTDASASGFVNNAFGFSATFNVSGASTSNTSGFLVQCVSGGAVLLPNQTAWSVPSDWELKTGFEPIPIEGALARVTAWRAGTYLYKTDTPDALRRVGLIAQDVQKTRPEAVSVGEDGMLQLRLPETVPDIVAALADAQNMILALNDRLAILEAK